MASRLRLLKRNCTIPVAKTKALISCAVIWYLPLDSGLYIQCIFYTSMIAYEPQKKKKRSTIICPSGRASDLNTGISLALTLLEYHVVY